MVVEGVAEEDGQFGEDEIQPHEEESSRRSTKN